MGYYAVNPATGLMDYWPSQNEAMAWAYWDWLIDPQAFEAARGYTPVLPVLLPGELSHQPGFDSSGNLLVQPMPEQVLAAPEVLMAYDPGPTVDGVISSADAPVEVAPMAMQARDMGYLSYGGEEGPGYDLRDAYPMSTEILEGGGGPSGAMPASISLSGLLELLPAVVRGAVIGWFSDKVKGTSVKVGDLPGWLKAILIAAGLGLTTLIIVDLLGGPPGILPNIANVFGGNGGPPGVQVVGKWDANGVTFYRLADGRLAVQNKRGRWKIWRPKRPIVLMPGGANNLRTVLRADAVLNKEAKRIAKMLNRRGQKRATSSRPRGQEVLIASNPTQLTRIGG